MGQHKDAASFTAVTQNLRGLTTEKLEIIINVELREENPKTSQENLINICFAGLHERAILPEATGRCKRLD
jgi:hypothetical protein